MTEWKWAPEVGDIARKLIADVPAHSDLGNIRIEFVFRDKAVSKLGRTVLGTAKRISGLNAFLASDGEDESFYVIEIAEPEWNDADEKRRRALVDHELMHCKVTIDDDGTPKLKMRGHDVEEFVGIVERHGLWKGDVEHLVVVGATQLRLDLDHVTGELLNPDGDEPGGSA